MKSHRASSNSDLVSVLLRRCLVIVALLASERFHPVKASSSASSEIVAPGTRETSTMTTKRNNNDIRVVFSDVDGTLVHYPQDVNALEVEEPNNRILKLPPSATGMQGIISFRTLAYCRDLRHEKDQKLVLISGMRTTTLLKRLPYLPRADAYCSEAGGRIFYPCEPKTDNTYSPQVFDGATQSDLIPFGLEEDLEWRRRMEKPTAAGTEGYEASGNQIGSEPRVPDVAKRSGLLWDFARTLISQGYVLDTKGYSSCFRVNRKQQTSITDEQFNALLNGKVEYPEELGTSTNLGCVDFYPVESGKKHCCEYLARKFCNADGDNLAKHAICLCDDDNDLEMALACRHAFVPGISSDSMAAVIQANPTQITATGGPGTKLEGIKATEKALELALESIHSG